MSFLTPVALALAGLLPIIVAMYILKLRREDRTVSSTYLWQRLVRDYEANTPWQRLRRNLLLLLQLLFLTALILALARPFLPTEGAAGQSLILILDTSASMAATDVSPSRLDVARARANALIDSLPDGARVTIIAAGSTPRVLVSGARDPRVARNALGALRIDNGPGDLTTALSLASAAAARQSQAEIVILSDGRVALAPTEVPAAVRYIPIGQHGDNQAVSALSLRELAGGQATSLFVQVSNYGPEAVTRRLDIHVDGRLFDAREIAIPAGGTAEIIQDNLPPATQQVEVRLDGRDGLALDDRAWAVHTVSRPAPVLLVTEGNLFLETALALLPTIELTVIRPADFTTQFPIHNSQFPIHNSQFPTPAPSLTIFDRTVPTALPATNALFIAPPAPTAWFTPTGTIDTSQLTIPNSQFTIHTDPLMRYVDLSQLQILEAQAIPLPAWARPLVTAVNPAASSTSAPAPGWPLLFAGEVSGRRVAVLAFDLRNSDLVLRPAFPLLMSNLIDFLIPGTRGLVPAQVRPGEPVTLTVPPEIDQIAITHPDGRQRVLIPEQGRLTLADTGELGVYLLTLTAQGNAIEQSAFAVNLFSAEESAIAPRATLPVAGAATGPAGGVPQSQGRRELWRPLALIALALLLLEWLAYHSPLTSYVSRFTSYVSRFTFYVSLITLLTSCSLFSQPPASPTPAPTAIPTSTAPANSQTVAPISGIDDTGAELVAVEPEAALKETYRNAVAGYAFDYPAGWLTDGEGEYVSLQNYRSEDLPPRDVNDPDLYKIEFVWIRPGQARTVDEMLEQMRDGLAGPPEQITLNDLEGVRVRARGYLNDVSDVLLLDLRDRVLLIQSWQGGRLFDRITATVRPIKGAD